jgi:[acyl-carrier-protein] S-malonyltransferase
MGTENFSFWTQPEIERAISAWRSSGILASLDDVDIAAATPLLLEAGAKRVLPLNVSGAFHSPLMTEPSRNMAEALSNAVFQPGKPVYANVTTQPVKDPSAWRETLEQQLRDQVRWTESVRNMIADGVTEFIEFGPGEVLCGMLKRIDKSVPGRRFSVN